MENNNKNCNKSNSKIGSSLGVVIGFFSALLFNNIILILIGIALGVGYDNIKNKRK